MLPGADAGFKVIRGLLKKFRRAKRGSKIFGVFCVKNQDFMQKNQDFMQKNHIFSNFRGWGRARGGAPLESATGSGSDNNST